MEENGPDAGFGSQIVLFLELCTVINASSLVVSFIQISSTSLENNILKY